MTAYVYRITAKKVQTPVGLANVAVYAYKPSWALGWSEGQARFQTGCVASERMVANGNHTGLSAFVNDAGDPVLVFRTGDRATFYDDMVGEKYEVLWSASDNDALEVASVAITGKRFREFCETVQGGYTPSVSRAVYGDDLVNVFAAGFMAVFDREVHVYG